MKNEAGKKGGVTRKDILTAPLENLFEAADKRGMGGAGNVKGKKQRQVKCGIGSGSFKKKYQNLESSAKLGNAV